MGPISELTAVGDVSSNISSQLADGVHEVLKGLHKIKLACVTV